ncbi:MAG TPA: hypothetical protein VNJ46_02795 [Gaiellaceae bacterium]|nr:hypothetical protein [Gaiellaceae bacterium]
MTGAEEALARARDLLDRLEERRAELERLSQADDLEGERAVEVVAEIAELAKQIEGELARARSLADAQA